MQGEGTQRWEHLHLLGKTMVVETLLTKEVTSDWTKKMSSNCLGRMKDKAFQADGPVHTKPPKTWNRLACLRNRKFEVFWGLFTLSESWEDLLSSTSGTRVLALQISA